MINNIILIGMPGSGKTTCGQLLAGRLNRGFIDTDWLIDQYTGKPLQQIVDTEGYSYLRKLESSIILGMDVSRSVISTGGSVIYSDPAMKHLKSNGLIVYLHTDLEVLQQRIGDYSTRGLAKPPEQTLFQLYEEREPLYERYAELVIDITAMNPNQTVEKLIRLMSNAEKY